MTRACSSWTAVGIAILAVPVAAQVEPEALSAAARAGFEAAAGPLSARLRPAMSSAGPDGAVEPVLAADIELRPLLNRQLRTSLRYQLAGRTAWFSCAYDARRNVYLSLLVDGAEPRYFSVRNLLYREEPVVIGGRAFTLRLDASIFNRMQSRLALTDDETGREEADFSFQDMLDAVTAVGDPVALPDQTYRVYYTDGPDGARANPGVRLVVFVRVLRNDYEVFILPEKMIPSGVPAPFTMFGGKQIGLLSLGGRLRVYEYPSRPLGPLP